MDEHLKKLMRELGQAINQCLAESERIAEVLEEIRNSGYDVILVLEATIGFNRLTASEPPIPQGDGRTASRKPRRKDVKIRWTPQDQKFLRSLRIAVDED